MSYLKVTLKDHPSLQKVIRAAFPDYRKKAAFISIFSPNGENINSYWSGGSRDEHVLIELATLRRKALPTSTHPFFDITAKGFSNVSDGYVEIDHVGNVRLKAIPPGYALVTAGTFCGKPATASVKVHPDSLLIQDDRFLISASGNLIS